MMERCETCGQWVADRHGHPTGKEDQPLGYSDSPLDLDIDRLGPQPAESRRARSRGSARPSGGINGKILAVVAALGGLWLLVALIAGPSTTELVLPGPTATPLPTATPAPIILNEPTPAPTPEPTPVVIPTPEPITQMTTEVGLESLRRRLGAETEILYRIQDGVARINLTTGAIDRAIFDPTAPGFSIMPGNPVRLLPGKAGYTLFNGGRTNVTFVNAGEVHMVTDLDHRVYAWGDATTFFPPGQILALGPQSIGEVDAPTGPELIAIDGFGLLAVSAGGGSELLTPDGFVQISEHVVVTAVDGAHIERRCQPFRCDMVLIRGTDEHELPQQFGAAANHLLSPDGDSVLVWSETGRAEVYSPDESYSTTVGDGVRAPVWSPDSSFVMWLDFTSDRPKINVVFPADREWMAWDISATGAPNPISPQLLIW